jgi:hypothetical protein
MDNSLHSPKYNKYPFFRRCCESVTGRYLLFW